MVRLSTWVVFSIRSAAEFSAVTTAACDELLDANARIRALEGELETLRNVRVAASDRAKATQVAVANALNAAADRIEKTTQVLNRTIGNGVAIG